MNGTLSNIISSILSAKGDKAALYKRKRGFFETAMTFGMLAGIREYANVIMGIISHVAIDMMDMLSLAKRSIYGDFGSFPVSGADRLNPGEFLPSAQSGVSKERGAINAVLGRNFLNGEIGSSIGVSHAIDRNLVEAITKQPLGYSEFCGAGVAATYGSPAQEAVCA